MIPEFPHGWSCRRIARAEGAPDKICIHPNEMSRRSSKGVDGRKVKRLTFQEVWDLNIPVFAVHCGPSSGGGIGRNRCFRNSHPIGPTEKQYRQVFGHSLCPISVQSSRTWLEYQVFATRLGSFSIR